MTTEPQPGVILRVPLPDGTCALAQIVAVEPQAVAVSISDGIWSCEPGPLDWQHSGRALLHLALRPAALDATQPAGAAEVEPDALAAHARWRAEPVVTPAPLAVIVQALLAG